MAKEITIDIERLQNADGNYSEADLKIIQRATGKTVNQLLNESESKTGFTEEEVKNMSDAEFEENREAILRDMANG